MVGGELGVWQRDGLKPGFAVIGKGRLDNDKMDKDQNGKLPVSDS